MATGSEAPIDPLQVIPKSIAGGPAAGGRRSNNAVGVSDVVACGDGPTPVEARPQAVRLSASRSDKYRFTAGGYNGRTGGELGPERSN